MGSVARVGRAFEMGLREYARTPVLVALLLFLPAYFIGMFVYVLPASEMPITVPGDGRMLVSTADLYGVLLVPLLAGLIGGIAGMFLMQAARDADGRLVLAGYRPAQVILARFGLLVLASVVATAVALAVLSVAYVPESLGVFVGASVLAGLIYGLVGVLVGLVLGRLAGVYTMLFVPMLDVFFLQNPTVEEQLWVAPYFPGHAVTELAVDAGFSASVSLDPLWEGLAMLAVVAVLATAAFYRTTRVR
ncbi:MAG: ABC transporter permease [Halapricum sp.]